MKNLRMDKSYGVPQYLPFYNYVAGSLGIISAFYSTPKIFIDINIALFLCFVNTFFKKILAQKTRYYVSFMFKKIFDRIFFKKQGWQIFFNLANIVDI